MNGSEMTNDGARAEGERRAVALISAQMHLNSGDESRAMADLAWHMASEIHENAELVAQTLHALAGYAGAMFTFYAEKYSIFEKSPVELWQQVASGLTTLSDGRNSE
jgi:hypothetical protein